jgi:hypothetical protein
MQLVDFAAAQHHFRPFSSPFFEVKFLEEEEGEMKNGHEEE